MRLLLDTNRYSDLLLRQPEVVERFQTASQVWLSLISLGELRAGFQGGSRVAQNEAQLRDLLDLQGVHPLGIDTETTELYGQLHARLKAQGAMIPTNDLWIAAQAIQHNLTLDTRDDHFRKVDDLKLVQPENRQ